METKLHRIAVLFARKDSIYKSFQGVDVYDAERDARTFKNDCPVIAHPPCRLWSKMNGLSTAPASEKELARWAVNVVRKNGGILEHPASSKLWKEMNLPGTRDGFDPFGGWTLGIHQWTFGHPAEKRTKLYIVGIRPTDIPEIPLKLGYPEYVVSTTNTNRRLAREMKKADRDKTPHAFAVWLIETARRIDLNLQQRRSKCQQDN